MTIYRTDVALIGAGTAGMVAYKAARSESKKVLLIDGGTPGTTCARVGCMPSKLLIAAAEASYLSRHSQVFGVINTETHVEGKAVMARVRRERSHFVGSVLKTLERIPAAERLQSHARFIDPHRLALDNGDEVHFETAVIATGFQSYIPDPLAAAGSRLLTSETVFELPDLPQRLAVIGSGAIGLELGQAFSRLGVDVRLFGSRGRLAGIRDPAVKAYAAKVLGEEFDLDLQVEVTGVREVNHGVVIGYRNSRADWLEESFDYLLVATGRRPNIASLNLAKTGLKLDKRGMPACDPFTLQCGDSHLFMAGDVDNDRSLLHEAVDEGRIAGRNAATFPDLRAGLRRAPLAIVFSEPQIASVGLNMEQVRLRCGNDFAVGEVNFEDQGRARIMAANRGLLRVYGEKGSGLFLGAEMIGPRAEHIAHLLSWAAQQHMTVPQMLEMPYYHPVVEEGVRTALQDLRAKLKMGPQLMPDCLNCGPGG